MGRRQRLRKTIWNDLQYRGSFACTYGRASRAKLRAVLRVFHLGPCAIGRTLCCPRQCTNRAPASRAAPKLPKVQAPVIRLAMSSASDKSRRSSERPQQTGLSARRASLAVERARSIASSTKAFRVLWPYLWPALDRSPPDMPSYSKRTVWPI